MSLPSSTELLIADTSPLLALARVDGLSLLPQLLSRVLVTDSVWQECIAKPERDDARRISEEAQQAIMERVRDPEIRSALAGLDRGEQTALELALQTHATVLLDERRGRAVTKAHGLKYIGALGVLLLAKRQRLIPQIRPLLTHLMAGGYYLSDQTIARALELANE